MELSQEELQDLYVWVDEVPLSRPKRNIARDFSDGVLTAEVAYHFFPKLVQLHNYSAANSFAQKMYNWNTLNAKVFSKLGFVVPKADCEATAQGQPMAIEHVLRFVRTKFAEVAENGGIAAVKSLGSIGNSESPGASPKASSSPLAAYSAQHAGTEAGKPTEAANGLPRRKAAPLEQAPLHSETASQQQQTIRELREMNEILETKTRKLEQLVRLKDAKIQTLTVKLQAAGLQ